MLNLKSIPTIFLLILFLVNFASSSHFRFGVITWKPITDYGTTVKIEFTARWAWRRSYKSDLYCDDNTISSGATIGIPGNIVCDVGCTTSNEVIGDIYFECTQYSVSDDWTMGEKIFEYTLPKSSNIQASFTGGDWITLISGGKIKRWGFIKR
jgi:hypothetical protein